MADEVVGLAVARELTRRRPGARVVVLEKEDRVAVHQTGHNSGVVHAGVYYRPGSLKALLCTRGGALLREYCAQRRLPYDRCGNLVVAVTRDEVTRLGALAARAGVNLVQGLRRVGPAEIREIEPYATRPARPSPTTCASPRRSPTTSWRAAVRCASASRSPGSPGPATVCGAGAPPEAPSGSCNNRLRATDSAQPGRGNSVGTAPPGSSRYRKEEPYVRRRLPGAHLEGGDARPPVGSGRS